MFRCKGCNIGGFGGQFFYHICEINFFCFVVAMCDLVQDMETVCGPKLTANSI